MKNSIATCFYAEQLLDFQELSEFDLQVSEQYLHSLLNTIIQHC